MQSELYRLDELDDSSRDYLLTVRRERGHGMPGIFIPHRDHLPILMAVLGTILLLGVAALVAFSSLNGGVLGYLTAAGLLLGGWLMLGAIRLSRLRARPDYLGEFLYTDTLQIWESRGDTVLVTPFRKVDKVEGRLGGAGAAFSESLLVVRYVDGAEKRLVFYDAKDAEQVLQFFHAVLRLRREPALVSSVVGEDVLGFATVSANPLDPVRLGMAARVYARTGSFPPINEQVPSKVKFIPCPDRLAVTSTRATPWGTIAVVPTAIVVIVVSHWGMTALHDRLALRAALNAGNPAELRRYLIDSTDLDNAELARNRLREIYAESVQELAKRYTEAAAKQQEYYPTSPTLEPTLREGMKKLLHLLAELPQPYLTLEVQETLDPVLLESLGERREQRLVNLREDWLAHDITAVIGPELVDLVAPASGSSALIEVRYTIKPQPKNPNHVQIDWTTTLRDPSKTVLAERRQSRTNILATVSTVSDALYSLKNTTLAEMIGRRPDPPTPQPIMGGVGGGKPPREGSGIFSPK